MITGRRGSRMLLLRSASAVIPIPDPFPQELVDRIIDEVRHRCIATLKACSVVCRSWRTRAMRHLVRPSFTLDLSHSRSSTIKTIQTLPQFIKFKAPPTFPASFVTAMYIGCIYKAKLVQEVMCYLHLYPNLRELELDDVFFSHSIMKTLSKALDKFPPPPLHRLDLREISFTDSEHFLSFVGMSHFSAISVLDMDCISYSKGQRKCSNRFCWKNASVKHDPRFGGPSFATSLALRGDYQSAGSPIKDIIHLLGKSITELKLAVCFETGKLTRSRLFR
ncbi:hypothetical protein K435DRAFT_974107 [Dendrothele bispora CBS 962.96]|uniref:F-box domain-containing protein n=1 Tax=Dendrothele bispora (strain CBS 962.96) TaxID=1314807 RepID=A0A4S8KNA5_DENBC|nr:hypothetical protein K435DRAFT_974107 [Dendrothele bispora CBS 962.96]